MKPTVVSDILAVGEVPSAEEIEILAKAGFKSIINNQPDGEVERFAGSAAIAKEAARAGLAHAYAPITSRTPSPEELRAFETALATLPAPIYAFCYSGARSAAATAFLLAAEAEPDTVIREFEAAGYDIRSLEPWLIERNEHAKPRAKANGGGNGHWKGEAALQPATPANTPDRKIEPAAAALALQGIIVRARPRGAGGFAM